MLVLWGAFGKLKSKRRIYYQNPGVNVTETEIWKQPSEGSAVLWGIAYIMGASPFLLLIAQAHVYTGGLYVNGAINSNYVIPALCFTVYNLIWGIALIENLSKPNSKPYKRQGKPSDIDCRTPYKGER